MRIWHVRLGYFILPHVLVQLALVNKFFLIFGRLANMHMEEYWLGPLSGVNSMDLESCWNFLFQMNRSMHLLKKYQNVFVFCFLSCKFKYIIRFF